MVKFFRKLWAIFKHPSFAAYVAILISIFAIYRSYTYESPQNRIAVAKNHVRLSITYVDLDGFTYVDSKGSHDISSSTYVTLHIKNHADVPANNVRVHLRLKNGTFIPKDGFVKQVNSPILQIPPRKTQTLPVIRLGVLKKELGVPSSAQVIGLLPEKRGAMLRCQLKSGQLSKHCRHEGITIPLSLAYSSPLGEEYHDIGWFRIFFYTSRDSNSATDR